MHTAEHGEFVWARIHPRLPSVLITQHYLLAVSSAGCHIPHHLELTISHGVDVVVEVDTRADVPWCEPDLVGKCDLAVALLLQPQAAMLGAPCHYSGTGSILGDRQTGSNPDSLLAAVHD